MEPQVHAWGYDGDGDVDANDGAGLQWSPRFMPGDTALRRHREAKAGEASMEPQVHAWGYVAAEYGVELKGAASMEPQVHAWGYPRATARLL